MEQFYQIPGLDGYFISQSGAVWSEKTHKYLRPHINRYGYFVINLRKGGKQCTKYIHKLLAETFIPNPDDKPTVDHINQNRRDNRLENLRWATYQEQVHNRACETFVHNAKPVECISKSNPSQHIATFSSCCEAAAIMFGDKRKNSLIHRCALGKKPSAYGYRWKFVNM